MGTFRVQGREAVGGTFAIPHMGGSIETDTHKSRSVNKSKMATPCYPPGPPDRSFGAIGGSASRGAEPKCLSQNCLPVSPDRSFGDDRGTREWGRRPGPK